MSEIFLKTNTLAKDQLEQYQAVRDNGAGLIDLSSRGRIIVAGSEAVMFLNGLITNDMKTLLEGQWMRAAFPNAQGRLIAAVRVIRLPDEPGESPRFLLDTEAATHKAVLKTTERFSLAGDFRVTDVTAETKMLSVQGKRSLAAVRAVLGDPISELRRDGAGVTRWNDIEVTVIRASHTAEDGFDVVVDLGHAEGIANELINTGALPVADETFETLRIEAGVARFGTDMDETNVVTETNLDDAVSFTKGCYIGQEIIARIKYRGHVAKKLTGLLFEGSKMAEPAAVIKSGEGKDIGRIT
ncbi:MAG TPA: hypothetical protein VGQ39_02780, partial [Pyrinomonadaceae bacterium]|nr:hypothetical protein [Pyrinomonadaceae bacterium]